MKLFETFIMTLNAKLQKVYHGLKCAIDKRREFKEFIINTLLISIDFMVFYEFYELVTHKNIFTIHCFFIEQKISSSMQR